MTGVDRVRGPGAVRRSQAARAASGSGAFAIGLERAAEADGAHAAAEAACVAEVAGVALDGVLALQEADDRARCDRAAYLHSDALLAALGELQRELLREGANPPNLERLASLVRSLPRASDPGLRAAAQAVALRASVELARRGFA